MLIYELTVSILFIGGGIGDCMRGLLSLGLVIELEQMLVDVCIVLLMYGLHLTPS